MSDLLWTTVGRLLARDRSPVRRRPSARQRFARIGAVVVFVAVAYAAYAATHSPALRVRHVAVSGASHVPAERIREASGLMGASILRIPRSEAEARLERLPYVAQATVHGRWSSSVRVEIEERSPRLLVRSGNAGFLVDVTGVALEPATENQAASLHLPVLDLAPAGDLRPGGRVEPRRVAFALTLFGALPQDVRPLVERLTYRPERGYVLTSSVGWTAQLGDDSRPGVKAQVLRKLLAKDRVAYVDVSTPATPYYRTRPR